MHAKIVHVETTASARKVKFHHPAAPRSVKTRTVLALIANVDQTADVKLVRPLLAAAPRSVKTRTVLALIANVDQTVDVKLVRPPVDLSPHLQQRNFSSLEPSLSLLQQVLSFS